MLHLSNEALILGSLVLVYSLLMVVFAIFRQKGLHLWTVLATITANIEVLILVNAFGMEMTLGNVLFASTFLVTDIASELYGKKEAQSTVYLGITASLAFMLISQTWLLYTPNENDFAFPAIQTIFSNTPRLIFASLSVYVVVQLLDVQLYHFWWNLTSTKTGNSRGFLWLRNNGSTLISQFFNAVLFNFLAFWGTYDIPTLWSISMATYVIYIATSLADTPFVYLARWINERKPQNK